jgi:hypothetical protein
MRTIRTAMKGIGALAVAVALMAAPSIATASPEYPMQWVEHDEDPIGTVTADVSGTIEVDVLGAGIAMSADCDVVGEVELTNDWNADSPATQRLIGLHPAGTVANSCTGSYGGYPLSHVTYNSPWTGSMDGYQGDLDGLLIQMKWAGGVLQASTGGHLETMLSYEVNVGNQSWCTGGFTIDDATLSGAGYNSRINGHLDFDLESLEGLSTEEGGPCVMLADYYG